MPTYVASLLVSLFAFVGDALPAPAPAITTEHAARLYRIETYNNFRHDRPEYDRRIATGAQVWKSFNDAGQPNEQRDAVLAWFVSAREAARQRQAIPALPQFDVEAPHVVATEPADPEVVVPVITSGREESPLVDAIPDGVATSLDIQLPPSAEPTEPAPAKFVKQTTTTMRSPDPNVEGTTAPIIIQLPTGKRVDTAKETPESSKPATPTPAKKEPTPATPPAAEPAATEDPFAVKNLFEPATTPAPATEAATDADPFAP